MQPISLLYTTGHKRIDDIIRGLIGIFEAAFPDRIRACYLAGSYADGSAVPLSDIDIRLVFKGGFQDEEEMVRVRCVRDDCRLLSPIDIDLPPLSEERLMHDDNWVHEAIGIKLAGVLLYGEDIRASLHLPGFEVYTRKITAAPIHFLARFHGGPPLTFPLTYPDSGGAFYGYDELDSSGERSTKMLVHIAGFTASCILALRAGLMVMKKSDWLAAYTKSIGDEWTTFLETLYTKCKLAWGYRIPDGQSDRQILRDLCRQALIFENHYLTIYREYLLAQLRGDDISEQLFAAGRLKDIIYPEILPRLKALQSTSGAAQTAIEEALAAYTAALAGSTNMQRHSI
jgi:predicted nucleotidyltransferase